MIRVLYVAHDANMYGASQSLLYLIRELKNKKEVEPLVLVPSEGKFTEELRKNKIRYLTVKYYLWQAVKKTTFRFIIKKIIRRTWNFFAKYYLFILLKNERIDLIHSNSSVVEMGAEIARKFGIPHIWHIREFGKEDFGCQYLYSNSYVKRRYEEAETLITVSKELQCVMQKKCAKANVVTIYNGVHSKLSMEEKEERRKSEPIQFCQVASLSSAKNQLFVLKACKLLKERYQVDFVMNFVGDGAGDYYNEMLKFIAVNNMKGYVKLWGFQEDISDILQKMDIGITASKMEGFGRATVEYMLAGLPVIGHATGGTKEIVEDGESGLLYSTLDELAEKMLFLAENEKERLKMGRKGRAIAKKKYTVEGNAEGIYQIYYDIL